MLCMGLGFAACSSSENEQVTIEPTPEPVATRSLSQEEFDDVKKRLLELK